MPRYVIIGAGALGTSLAAQLHESGVRSVLVGRPPHVEVLRERGLRYVRPHDVSLLLELDVRTEDELAELEPDDVLVITTKTQDLEEALVEWAWRPVSDGRIAADLPVITVQNGLEAESRALRRFRTVLGASVNLPAGFVEPGVVEVRSHPTVAIVTIGPSPAGPSELAQQVAADWGRSGYAVEVVEDVTRWKAAKLLFNVNNAVDVFSGDPNAVTELKARLVAEARAVLDRARIETADRAEHTIDTSGFVVTPRPADRPWGMSTWQSFARAGTSGHEVDFLNGEVVLLGRLHGVPTPLNESVQRILGASFRAGEAPGTRSIDEVLRGAAVSG